ncbi:phosphoribosylanthranilate isomerase [Nitrincola tapanii]|uniref:N-(5'-phosphoribosyl)anthranilate isomerase n=1 Tax=Nitrincola tapanii TaxID=1708751 RepID=A0A5A9W504_9GAMM|nr:phosphoribosylanthranilate isomerase [Nitrincola tapanii]KAA0875856.1 phosphoribosylanthranilate isomerase [Nitrincola tapanii]
MRTRVKICGITRLQDALAAVEAGADALGFVFYPPSPRAVTPAQAAEIIAALPPFVTTTALFVNAQRNEIDEVVALTQVDLLQFHGDETPEFCQSVQKPFIRALRVKPETDLQAAAQDYAAARALLLDTYVAGVPGGTGAVFDWQLIPETLRPKIVLAGGLTPQSVAQAVAQIRPWAVDVSGGVEQAPGIKDAQKIQEFINEVNRVHV